MTVTSVLPGSDGGPLAREQRRPVEEFKSRIVMFGLSGGLIPCSAAIVVLVLCLQVNRIWLGVALVLSFSIGLAITLIAAGMIAAVGMRHFSRRWSGLGELAQRLPYLSSIVMIGF